MRRLVGLAALSALFIVLLGCTPSGSDDATQPTDVKKRAVVEGDRIGLSSGITLTIPAGWEGTLTVDPSPSGALRPKETLVLDVPAEGAPTTAIIFISSAADTITAEAVGKYARQKFTDRQSVGPMDILVGTRKLPSGRRMMAGLTAASGRDPGVICFGSEPTRVEDTLGWMGDVLAIDGP